VDGGAHDKRSINNRKIEPGAARDAANPRGSHIYVRRLSQKVTCLISKTSVAGLFVVPAPA
jgi:hypothetical protein